MEAAPRADWKEALIAYVREHGDSLDFTRHFWKGCEPLEADLEQYHRFSRAIQMFQSGYDPASISVTLRASVASVKSWRPPAKMPKLGHYLKAYVVLGKPRELFTWINTECTHGHAIPIGHFLQVPTTIHHWPDVEDVLSQLRPLSQITSSFDASYLFGFLVGMIIGDGAKSKQETAHRHIGLVFSKKYDTNLALGDFTCTCAQSIGLRMQRSEDLARPSSMPHGFQWTSQSSPLLDWLYNVALGLREGEVTTYDSLHADWILGAPREFRVGLIQGLAESDGSPSVASQAMEFWVGPNWDLMIELLATLGLRAFRCRDAVSLSKSQTVKSFDMPIFAPHLNTVRYQRLKLIATTKRLRKEERLSVGIRSEIMELAGKGVSVPKIINILAESRGVLISFEAAQRWSSRPGKKPQSRTHCYNNRNKI